MLCNLFQRTLLAEVKRLSIGEKQLPLFHFSSSSDTEIGKTELTNQKVTVERTITQKDVDLFSQLSGDFNPIHSSSREKPSIVHGAFLNGLVSGVIGTKLPGPGTIVVSQNLRYPNPCCVGVTVEVTVEIESARKILKCNYMIVNKISRTVVLEGNAKLIFKRS